MSGNEPTIARRALDPHPALWAAFDQGALLRTILVDFYERVYGDPRLSPFFVNTTKSWAIDHQYAFLRQILTGEDCYFGDRPRNAHHWMVISNELFDYREALMAQVLREHGLREPLIADFRRIDESFRANIVKHEAFPRKRNGVLMPLEGWRETSMSAGGICDACAGIIEIDASAWYHLRTGETRCELCAMADGPAAKAVEPELTSGASL